MQLTIDTKHDSPEEIRKAIRMLMSLVGNKAVYTNDTYEEQKPANIFEEKDADMNGLMGIFDAPKNEKQEPEPKDDTPIMEFY